MSWDDGDMSENGKRWESGPPPSLKEDRSRCPKNTISHPSVRLPLYRRYERSV
jgi:hypothetical protein